MGSERSSEIEEGGGREGGRKGGKEGGDGARDGGGEGRKMKERREEVGRTLSMHLHKIQKEKEKRNDKHLKWKMAERFGSLKEGRKGQPNSGFQILRNIMSIFLAQIVL